MDYPFEILTPEVFQEFCQALLTKEYPGTQCFPVAQPDGGRDATAPLGRSTSGEFIVFQVKFVRQPAALADPHVWFDAILRDEAPKITALLPLGAVRFVLLTNVRGTAHPKTGSIDRVAASLTQLMPPGSQVWWRDDLARRLDGLWDLKWVYPQLMTGPDLIRTVVESGSMERDDRLAATVMAFITDQFALDEQVRFKQVELENKLLDLFVDVPIGELRLPVNRNSVERISSARRTITRLAQADPESGLPAVVGAAMLLLDGEAQLTLSHVVLEGAPGQGKSTITQYVSQVHRMRLLDKQLELSEIPEAHRLGPVRLPFKVDLRDLATWLNKHDPFSATGTESPPAGWHRSLEAFLSALVKYHSGGAEFTVSDLQTVARNSACLIVLDGLDEVADIARRHDVAEEIIRGVRRLRATSRSLQVIVTSRPAAFANPVVFPEDSFQYLQLDMLPRPVIDEYTKRWLRARHVQERDSDGVKRILHDKLDQPHIRDLARNPMQLSILLSLVHTRGASLPDKRTALYDAYVDLFLTRESEKNVFVRDNRDLLVNIHRYVAWTLHCEAERAKSNGRVTRERLVEIIQRYLKDEGHDESIAEVLFTGMVERVVALVSRVEGTYEFEVQPLREYFAARFLYETAPYSPPGNERRGTKPDRFDALARNFYWTNVARFFAGCFSKGEIPVLVDRLQELAQTGEYRRIAHPRLLAATLLSDWVFAQYPRSMAEVVSLVLDPGGLRTLIASSTRRQSSTFTLPSRNGREQLIDRCFEILRAEPPFDFANDIIRLLRTNGRPAELRERWWAELPSRLDKTPWLRYGTSLGALADLTPERVQEILELSSDKATAIGALLDAGQYITLQDSEALFSQAVDVLLDGGLRHFRHDGSNAVLARLASSLDLWRYELALGADERSSESLASVHLRYVPFPVEQDQVAEATYPEARACSAFISVVDAECKRDIQTWATSIAPWERIVGAFISAFGSRLWSERVAVIGSHIRSSVDTCNDTPDPFDSSASLCRRARYARLRAGNVSWWTRQLEKVGEDDERHFVLLLFCVCASNNTIAALAKPLDAALAKLDDHSWQMLGTSIRLCWEDSSSRSTVIDVSRLPVSASPRLIAALPLHRIYGQAEALLDRYLLRYNGDDPLILTQAQHLALSQLLHGTSKVPQLLDLIARSYRAHVPMDYGMYASRGVSKMKLQTARLITDAADRYPPDLVALAQDICQGHLSERIRPLAEIAENDGW
jgi:hypothetical protein